MDNSETMLQVPKGGLYRAMHLHIDSNTVFDLITAHTPISAQSRNSVVFRLQPMYFFFTSL